MQGLYGYIRVGIQSLIDGAQQGGYGSFVRDQRQCVIIFQQLWKKRFVQKQYLLTSNFQKQEWNLLWDSLY